MPRAEHPRRPRASARCSCSRCHSAPSRRSIASDDAHALDVAALVHDAGFDPVNVGRLAHARSFDVGTPVYDTGMSGERLREALGLAAER